ncbi:MAG TPA: PKD domain-containing protein, partial [Flavobacteriales bacterium]|nr:PKD domain-containing protein [Flavobacteriales bacterium]
IGDTTQTLVVTQPGMYWVEGTDTFGYKSIDTIHVSFYVNSLIDTNLPFLCAGDTLLWDVPLDTSLYSFLWSDSSTDSTLQIYQAGTYSVVVTDTGGCAFYSDTNIVFIDSFPLTASLGPDDSICLGNSIGLTQGVAQADTYLWCNGLTTPEILPSTTGIYCLTATDTNGCIAEDSVLITVKGEAPTANFSMDTTCFGEISSFTDLSTVPFPYNIVNWTWDFGDGNSSTATDPSHYYDSVGVYNVSLSVTTDSGCFGDTIISIDIHPLPMAGFSPLITYVNYEMQFIDETSISNDSIISWTWVIDNLDTLYGDTPTYEFASTGIHDVYLLAVTNFGCSDSILQALTINSSPDYINGLQFWLRSDSVELVGSDTVSVLYDLSGNGYDAFQNGAVSRPIFRSSEPNINNHPAIVFDGSNDYMEGDTGLLGGITDFSFVIVCRINQIGSNWIYGNCPNGNLASFQFTGDIAAKFRFWPQGSSSSSFFSTSHVVNEYYIVSLVHSNDSIPQTRMKQGGFAAGSGNLDVNTHTDEGYVLGKFPAGSNYLNGEIIEVLLYDRFLDYNELYQVENYLRYRYFPLLYQEPVDLGPDILVSKGCDTLLDAGDRYEDYFWNTGDTTQTLVVTQPGMYWVEGTDTFGYKSIDTIH